MGKGLATGTAFTKAPTEEYRQITLFEADETYDWPDAGYFARKGLRAASGEAVAPEQIADWKLPADKVSELTSARTQLVELLNKTARDDLFRILSDRRRLGRFWLREVQ